MTPNQNQLVYWITERESIRKKKEAGLPAPWSDNKVMQETYFCNVNREDDKVTKWIRQNWLYSADTSNSYDFAMVVARIFNLPSTLEALGQPLDGKLEDWLWGAEACLWDLKAANKATWGSAYMVSTHGKKMDKIAYYLGILEKLAMSPNMMHDCKTLKEAHAELIKFKGVASFLAAQVVADLKNTSGHPLSKAEDWFSFSSHGPGSLRGLSWFFEETVTVKNYQSKINEAAELLEYELPEEILSILCNQNLQNCFCEYGKFMTVTNGTGRPKRKYNGV